MNLTWTTAERKRKTSGAANCSMGLASLHVLAGAIT
jgi:hypothetical protein